MSDEERSSHTRLDEAIGRAAASPVPMALARAIQSAAFIQLRRSCAVPLRALPRPV
jgi:hypothetical protein